MRYNHVFDTLFLETRVNFNLKSDAELFAIAKCKTVVSAIEGEVGFRRAVYIPKMAPMNNEDVVNPKTKIIRLYVKHVFISADFDAELVNSIIYGFQLGLAR
ncbi:hypothetical protein L1987_54867 [Smallanthus sonchifolius]|uniref:Uncharacterized protein n=1 Tax=Smallanthus sonchifolius TaxID=185202 RepID=A0ACB9E859_9ASTR|nr:hypothetical protein L1987_54867 [Smallanthus sonchifolius]